MKSLLLVIAAMAICFSAYAAAEGRAGVWTAELQDDNVQLTLFGSRNFDSERWGMGNLLGFEEPIGRFAGLSKSDLLAAAANVQFELHRPAGTLSFEGRVANGTGAGHFRFTPDDAFVREMDALGYRGFSDEKMLLFAAYDFSPQTVRDLRAMGYQPSQREIEEIAIFRVTADLLREFSRLGYPNLTLREVVNFRVGRVDAAYINAMRELGYSNLTARQLADLAILGVTPKYIRELQSLGYDKLTARQLEEMRALGVTPEYIRGLARTGYANIPVDKLLRLRETGADKILFK